MPKPRLDARFRRRGRDGRFEVRLPKAERDLLRRLPGELRELLEGEDPSLRRLFPPAYPEDPTREQEYRSLVREDLVEGKRSALEVLERTADTQRLTEEELVAWLGALNDLRLVIGTRLDVTDEDQYEEIDRADPRAELIAVYHYLGWLQEQVVAALGEGLDPSGTETAPP